MARAQGEPAIRGAQPGHQVRLRVSFGEIPEFGDVLQMATGKRYQVIGVKGKQLQALVLKPTDEIEPDTVVWQWRWTSRKRRSA
jgi:hypothetical protein